MYQVVRTFQDGSLLKKIEKGETIKIRKWPGII